MSNETKKIKRKRVRKKIDIYLSNSLLITILLLQLPRDQLTTTNKVSITVFYIQPQERFI